VVNRIKALAEHFNLSPTAFADRIEVARPVISHIFSERNRPSLEVIQKIGLAFPVVKFEWLLYGKGEMLKPIGNIADKFPAQNAIVSEAKGVDLQTLEPESSQLSTNQSSNPRSLASLISSEKKITKVLFFYQDNTFEEFSPGK
jgi:transcriptional regulator with XRE-family HTH domain